MNDRTTKNNDRGGLLEALKAIESAKATIFRIDTDGMSKKAIRRIESLKKQMVDQFAKTYAASK